MKLLERLNRIETKAPTERKILVVKYQVELTSLQYGEDKYLRHDGETEDGFIKRILAIVKKNPHPNGFYLVGNIY